MHKILTSLEISFCYHHFYSSTQPELYQANLLVIPFISLQEQFSGLCGDLAHLNLFFPFPFFKKKGLLERHTSIESICNEALVSNIWMNRSATFISWVLQHPKCKHTKRQSSLTKGKPFIWQVKVLKHKIITEEEKLPKYRRTQFRQLRKHRGKETGRET